MTKYLLLDIDDTIAPSMYRGSDAIDIETWGRGYLAIPKYIVEWVKQFSKQENQSIWCFNTEFSKIYKRAVSSILSLSCLIISRSSANITNTIAIWNYKL